ncbi:LEAF RUST 10 DISEASE-RESISTANCEUS RECEPTOR-LIKE PROTEIN KINASE-like 1.2 [Rutidosis leptorrhynchoides]|uniref:LEAF RUST 10 DISEASE-RESISTANCEUS RECEPTOR-LIKE PROTEIN KINASE-like 1.2 n=1 Tax=Rutidosis leptorrhynchoides TaxID=125765 RepID=UPI003A99C93A
MAAVAEANNETHPNCPSYLCSNVNISYPFHKIGAAPANQFCGYQNFGINCSSNNGTERPIFYIGQDSYFVENIIYEPPSILLVDYDVSPVVTGPIKPSFCPIVQHSINITTLPFEFSQFTLNLSFHFNCTNTKRFPVFAIPIPCLNDTSNNKASCVNIENTDTQDFNWTDYSCEDHVVTTVLRDQSNGPSGLNLGLNGEYGRALNRGFELVWWRWESEDCDKCEENKGMCGHHNTTGFLCFCLDGTTSKHHCKGHGINWKVKVPIAVLSGVFGIVLMCVIFFFWRRRKNKKRYNYGSSYMSRNIVSYGSSTTDPEKNSTYHGVQIFKYRELEKATNHFDPSYELGDGGFGTVYQGKLKDGRVVAVKRLYENNYKRVEQFMNEVGILAHLRHQNLVSLYGCTTHHSRELLLVYEYIPNGTVADHLHGEKSTPGQLTWATRMSIAVETASALVYLHASDVIHRDVKTNNILLDNCFKVKVADFGLSRLFPNNVTHVSTAPQGTPGYVDPEYHECYQLTSKSDVYSFGVVLIELISSKPAVDITRHRHEINLSNMALNKIRNDALNELVDPTLGFESDYEVRKMISAVAELAFQCLQNERDCRPSMDEVLETLIGIQNGSCNKKVKKDVFEVEDDAILLKNHSQTMSPDSVAIAWSTSTLSTSSG